MKKYFIDFYTQTRPVIQIPHCVRILFHNLGEMRNLSFLLFFYVYFCFNFSSILKVNFMEKKYVLNRIRKNFPFYYFKHICLKKKKKKRRRRKVSIICYKWHNKKWKQIRIMASFWRICWRLLVWRNDFPLPSPLILTGSEVYLLKSTLSCLIISLSLPTSRKQWIEKEKWLEFWIFTML